MSQGKTREHRLIRLAYTPIKRHLKVKAEANPYDPTWEPYFEACLGLKMADSLKGRRSLLYLWREQDGICPMCKQPITQWWQHHLATRPLQPVESKGVDRASYGHHYSSLPNQTGKGGSGMKRNYYHRLVFS